MIVVVDNTPIFLFRQCLVVVAWPMNLPTHLLSNHHHQPVSRGIVQLQYDPPIWWRQSYFTIFQDVRNLQSLSEDIAMLVVGRHGQTSVSQSVYLNGHWYVSLISDLSAKYIWRNLIDSIPPTCLFLAILLYGDLPHIQFWALSKGAAVLQTADHMVQYRCFDLESHWVGHWRGI